MKADTLERNALALVARLGPWLSPIPPAYFIARAAMLHLQANIAIAVIMAIAVEAVGIATIHTTLRAYTWNQEKRRVDPSAPMWLGLTLSLVYLCIGILLAVLLEAASWLAPVAVSAFFLLAGIAYVTLAMMADQDRREAAAASGRADEVARRGQEKAERARQREERRQSVSGKLPEVEPAKASPPKALPEGLARIPGSLEDFRHMVEAGEALPELLTGDILARHASVSDRTGRNWLAAVRRNGGAAK